MKKNYSKPQLQSVPVKLGVFGSYGDLPGNDNPSDNSWGGWWGWWGGHGGHGGHGGGHGGWW
jgi:hypothetical protein